MNIREIILTKEDCESILKALEDMESLTIIIGQEELNGIKSNPDASMILSLRR